MTTTLPNLAFLSDAATGRFSAAPTMPIGALAWSSEERSDYLDVGVPDMLARRTPRSTRNRTTRTRAAVAAALFGVITAGAVLGVALVDGTGSAPSPTTAVVVDRIDSAPTQPSVAAPAPAPNVTEDVVPTGAAHLTTHAVATPPVVAVASPRPAAPPDSTPDTSIIVGGQYPVYNGGSPITPTGHHDWDHHNHNHQDHQDHHDHDHHDHQH
jgi:hypothetical protein